MKSFVRNESVSSCGELLCGRYFWLAATFSYYKDLHLLRKWHCSYFRMIFVIFAGDIRNLVAREFPA